jgi:hypothetical protein
VTRVIYSLDRVLNESKIIDDQIVRILNSTARVDAHDFPRIKTFKKGKLCINMVQENNV